MKFLFLPCIAVFVFLFFFIQSSLFADEIYLKNGDRISGNINSETEEGIIVETEAIGSITINRAFVENILRSAEIDETPLEPEEDKIWQGEIAAGYTKASGNTQSNQFSLRSKANRKTEQDEFTLIGDVHYSSSNKKMDSQRWYGMGRYAFSFGENKKWYNFYKLELDHDRFANIDYRIIPSIGVGYWFSDEPDWKAMIEAGLGLEHVEFRDDTKDSDEAVLIPRAFFEKKLFGESLLSQDLTLYPSLGDIGEFRLHSETKLTNPIDDKLSLSLSLIDDYNANPPQDTKKNDLQIISALTYSF
jgi:putative salt-induced outer membrane protein YdiY